MADDYRELIDEVVTIRKLLMLALMRNGAKQDELAKALGVSQATMSRMLAGGGHSNTKKKR